MEDRQFACVIILNKEVSDLEAQDWRPIFVDAKALYPLVDPKKNKNNPGLDDNALKNAISDFLVARLNVPSEPQPLPDFWEGSTSSASDAGGDASTSQEAGTQVTAVDESSVAEASATADVSGAPPQYFEAQVQLTKSGTDTWDSLEIPPPEGLELESAWVAALLERQAAAEATEAPSGEPSESPPSEESTPQAEANKGADASAAKSAAFNATISAKISGAATGGKKKGSQVAPEGQSKAAAAPKSKQAGRKNKVAPSGK